MKTKTLHISMAYTFVGDTSIEVPADLTNTHRQACGVAEK